MDRKGNILVHRNVRQNDFGYFLTLVEPYRHDLTVACECTFNWYWLHDARWLLILPLLNCSRKGSL